MREITLNDFPKYSKWAARLLTLRKFPRQARTIERIDRDYDKNKYAKCLRYYLENPKRSIIDVKKFEFLGDLYDKIHSLRICISKKDRLFLTSYDKVMEIWEKLLFNTFEGSLNGEEIIIELGCGYGYNLSLLAKEFPSKTFLGGEYSVNAVTLANKLFKMHKKISVTTFNYYDSKWNMLEKLDRKAVIFTSHSIEQLPIAKSVLKNFIKYKTKIKEVIHLEPTFELYNESTFLGMMRKKYTFMNDHNRDIISSLKSLKVKFIRLEPCVFGRNPLNPTSIIKWKF